MRDAVAALLLAYAVVVAEASTRWLPRASWPLRAPRAGIAAWLTAALSIATSAVAAGLILAVPCFRISTDPAVLRACLSLMQEQYATPQAAAASLAGGVLALGVLGRVIWSAGIVVADARRHRASHDDALALVARPAPIPGVRIIDDDQAAVYCLPGRRRPHPADHDPLPAGPLRPRLATDPRGPGCHLVAGRHPYGRTAPSKVDAYQPVFMGSFWTSMPVCGASMM